MTEQELYQIYSKWTGELHFYMVRDLNAHLDVEYFPATYQFKVYSGYADEFTTATGIPGLSRPVGERSETIKLLTPLDDPTSEQLDELFRSICLAAARVLQIRIAKRELTWRENEREPREQDGTLLP